jgi:hypothetical protein
VRGMGLGFCFGVGVWKIGSHFMEGIKMEVWVKFLIRFGFQEEK